MIQVYKKIFFTMTFFLLLIVLTGKVQAWSNGGYSADPSNPDYGTHDWIAQHALDWLPYEEKWYIMNNLEAYLYGTELPDNGQAPDGIGDTVKHHVYYDSSEALVDDASASRALTEYYDTLNFLASENYANAAKNAGIMSHYIVDLAVFGHVMGSGTEWGSEQHHSDYETYVKQRTSNYEAEFNSYLVFDGSLSAISAYEATVNLAYDTTFAEDGVLTCVWMDQNYNWSNLTFKNRAGESLNLAVNYLADVLHTLYLDSPVKMFNITYDSINYHVKTYSNSTATSFNFTQSLKQISFDVTGTPDTEGFCNVTIPHTLLGGPYTVFIDTLDITPTSQPSNGTHTFLYFTYNHSIHTIKIQGTTVIPEFPYSILLSLFTIATLIVGVILRKNRQLRKKNIQRTFL